MPVVQQPDDAELVRACSEDPSIICEWVFDRTGSRGWAEVADVVLAAPARILLILAVALVMHLVVRRAIRRLVTRISNPDAHDRMRDRMRGKATAALFDESGVLSLRSAARANTLGQVLRSVATAVIWTIAVIMILGQFDINLGPLIAGAGIAGVAIGFGAQSLVRDFLSGLFMLVEDQYGVGDVIDAGEAVGIVEAVSLRTTRVRDIKGTVWHIPNGEITRVGNMSQQWARALVDVSVGYGTDIDRAQELIKRVADEVCGAREWRGKIIERAEIWGVEELGADGVMIRMVVKTKPGEQFELMRALRRRLLDALREAGIEIPFPQRAIWVQRDRGSSREGAEQSQDSDLAD